MQYVQDTCSITKEQVGEGEVRPLCKLCMQYYFSWERELLEYIY